MDWLDFFGGAAAGAYVGLHVYVATIGRNYERVIMSIKRHLAMRGGLMDWIREHDDRESR